MLLVGQELTMTSTLMSSYNDAADYEILVNRAIELRINQTPAERKLWAQLKSGLEGYEFLNQVVMVPFIPDFVCLTAKLIIELDGQIHEFQRDYDEDRDINLAVSGYKVLRFTNDEIFQDINKVIREITQECRVRDPLPLQFEALIALKAQLVLEAKGSESPRTPITPDGSLEVVNCSSCRGIISPFELRVRDHARLSWIHKSCRGTVGK